MKYISILITLLVFSSISHAQKSLLLNVQKGERYAYDYKIYSNTVGGKDTLYTEINADLIIEVQEVNANKIKFNIYMTNIELKVDMLYFQETITTRNVDTSEYDSTDREERTLLRSTLNKKVDIYTDKSFSLIDIVGFWETMLDGVKNSNLEKAIGIIGPSILSFSNHYLSTIYSDKNIKKKKWQNTASLKGTTKSYTDYECNFKLEESDITHVTGKGVLKNPEEVLTALNKDPNITMTNIDGKYYADAQLSKKEHWPKHVIVKNTLAMTLNINHEDYNNQPQTITFYTTVEIKGRKL